MTTIRKEFTAHMLNEQGKDKAALIAESFTRCLNLLEDVCGTDGREMSIVRTKLEEASYYAKRSMAQRPENQMSGPSPEPYEQNRDFIRGFLRFRDDGREWGGDMLLDMADGNAVIAKAEALTGGTILVCMDGVDRRLEFDRLSGACVDGAYFGKLRIALSELYRVHPETYRIRQAKEAAKTTAKAPPRFSGETPYDAVVSNESWDIVEEAKFLAMFPDAKRLNEIDLVKAVADFKGKQTNT